MSDSIPFFNTYIDPSSFAMVKKILKSTFVSEGKITAEFEEKLKHVGLSYPLCVNSGTSALHLALILAGVKGGDEVIVPAQTFISTALAVLYQSAKPIFADIDYRTGNIDPEMIKRKITKNTKAIIPVHWAGYPVDLDSISKIAKEYRLTVIEDAAHALGATYKGKPIGGVSSFTCFSFQAIKHVTTGDGGAIACKKAIDAKKGKQLRWFGIDRENAIPTFLGERQYLLREVGYKYHMNDYESALGIANLSSFEKRLKRRRQIAQEYIKHFGDFSGIELFSYTTDRESSWWLFGMHVERRVDFIRALKDRGVPCSVVHQRIDRHPIFGGIQKDLVTQARFDSTQIHLPVYERLTDVQVAYIISSVKKGW